MRRLFSISVLFLISILLFSSCSSSKKFVLKKEIDVNNTKNTNATLHPPIQVEEIADIDDVGYRSSGFIDDGIMYVGNLDGDVYAIDLNKKTKTRIIHLKNEAIEVAPYVKGSYLYIGTNKGNLYKINYEEKKIEKKLSLNAPIMNKIYFKNDTLYVICEDDTINAVDKDSLELVWRYSNGTPSILDIRSTAGILFLDDGMYSGFSDGSISKISYYGERMWYEQVGDGNMFIDADSTPKGNSKIFVSSVNGYTEALDITDGSVLWKRKISTYANMEENIYGLFIADENGQIIALDNDNGETMWNKKVSAEDNVYAIKLIGNCIYAVTRDGVLVVLDALKGKIMDIKELSGVFSGRFMFDGSKLYLISRDGTVYSISSKK